MSKELIEGVFPVLITPMNEDYTVNYDGLRENLKYYVNLGVEGVVVVGSTGEFPTLNDEEKEKIMKIADEVTKDSDAKLIIGIADESTEKVIEYAKLAEKYNTDMHLLINSYYMTPTEEEAYYQFKDLNDVVNKPIMLYNNPFTANIDLNNDTIFKIDKNLDQVTHIKESSGEIRKVREIINNSDLTLFCGADDLAYESFAAGAKGWISVAANIAPKSAMKLYELVKNDNHKEAQTLNKKLLPLCDFLEGSGKYVQIVKKGMELKGLSGGPSRKPRLGLNDEEVNQLKELLTDLNEL